MAHLKNNFQIIFLFQVQAMKNKLKTCRLKMTSRSGGGRRLKSRGQGFDSWHHTLDGHDIFHIDLLLKLYRFFEKTENKGEGAGVGPFKKMTSRKQMGNLQSTVTFHLAIRTRVTSVSRMGDF